MTGAPPGPPRPRRKAPLQAYLSAVILLAMVPLALALAYQMFKGALGEQLRLQSDLAQSARQVAAALDRELGPAGADAAPADAEHVQRWQNLLAAGAPPGGFGRLVDARGQVLAQHGSYDPGDDIAAMPTAAGGWRVQVGVPRRRLESRQLRDMLAALGTIAACLLLGLVVSTLAARRITRPLHLLVTEGPQKIPPPMVDEIVALRDALIAAEAHQAQSRAHLQRKAAEFEALFAGTPIGLAFVRDVDAGSPVHNAAMDELLGPAAEPPEMLHDGHALDAAGRPLQRAATSGRPVGPWEIELPGRGGRHVLMQAVPLHDTDGRMRGAVATAVDITERKRAEQRLLEADTRLQDSQRLIDLAQSAGELGFFRFDTQSATWTPGEARLFGIDAAVAPSSLDKLLDRIHPQDRGAVEATLRTMASKGQDRGALEFRVLLPDGRVRWLSNRVLMSFGGDGQPQQLVGATIDVTEQKTAELERGALILREQEARIEAEAANRAKDEFLAMLGHELRNPLGAIASAAEVLAMAGPQDERATQAQAVISRQTRQLTRLVDDLLDVGRVISGKVSLSRQRLDFAALVRRVADKFSLTGESQRHDIRLELVPAWVDADSMRLEQVVNNLLGNAIKYTAPGTRVDLTLAASPTQVVLSVRDEGPGIPPALLPKVFDLFVQGERPLDRRASGLGIGLTLVRRLVELHGGQVTADSSPAGSVFRVTLPAATAPAQAERRQAAPARHCRRILVVEDNDDARSALCTLLELDGHEVSASADGRAGLDRLLAERPEVAIVDIGLPGLTGFELARESRRAGYAGLLLALSGYSSAGVRAEALRHGFDVHMAKPVDIDALRRHLAFDFE